MSLEAEKHFVEFLRLQNFLESGDEATLSKVKIGKIYQKLILSLKKGIKRFQEILKISEQFATKLTSLNISVFYDLYSAELSTKQDDYFATSNFLYSAVVKQEKMSFNPKSLLFKLIQDKYDYSTYLVKAYIGDDEEVLQMIQSEKQQKYQEIEKQIQEAQQEQQETQQEENNQQETNKDLSTLKQIYNHLMGVKQFNNEFKVEGQYSFNLPCCLYSNQNMTQQQQQLYNNAQKSISNILKTYPNYHQLLRDNYESQEAKQLNLLLSTYKTNLYWFSHIYKQIKQIKYPLHSIETVVNNELQSEVVTFTTMNVKLQNSSNKLSESQQFAIFCWYLYQLEHLLQNPTKAQIFVDNNEYKPKTNIYTIAKHTEKGGIVEEQVIDQAMLYQYKKEICGIFYAKMQQFIQKDIKNINLSKILQYANVAVKQQNTYQPIDLQVIIPPPMPKPIFFDTVMDEIKFEDCFE